MRQAACLGVVVAALAGLLVPGCERGDEARKPDAGERAGADRAAPVEPREDRADAGAPAGGGGPEPGGAATPVDDAAFDAAFQRARQASDELTTAILMRLMRELGQGGPAQAARVCSEVAQELTAKQAEDDLTIRRVSLKIRNPADEPDAYERAKLEEFAATMAAGEMPRESAEVVESGGVQRLRYLRPVFVAGFCLNCHGTEETLDPAVPPILAERYPDDAATGYEEGDLRGAFSVTVELGD